MEIADYNTDINKQENKINKKGGTVQWLVDRYYNRLMKVKVRTNAQKLDDPMNIKKVKVRANVQISYI